MDAHDDELRRFEATGAPPLPVTDDLGHIENDGARIWYSAYGVGPPVILLHGGLGHGGQPRPWSQYSRWTAVLL
jgi:hypothetical protein